ncbi:MAG: hypothetical protein Tsb0020_11330 [Haliangiales bacterium]
MLTYFFMGLAVGVLSGVPIGPVNLAVIDAAYRFTMRRAVTIGFGGAIGDGIYAIVGILVMGPVLDAYPVVTPVLYAVSGVVLFVYALLAIRNQPSVAVDPIKPPAASEPQNPAVKASELPGSEVAQGGGGSWLSGVLVGIALILMNPAAVVTWVIIVGLFMQGATPANGLSATAGVMVGSFGWFTGVAYLTHRGKNVIGAKTLQVTRFVAYLILGYSIFALGRALHFWLS